MLSFFQSHRSTEGTVPGNPWISRLYNGLPPRKEAETRGMIYVPWEGEWKLTPRASSAFEASLGTQCNYMFWVRKPLE